MMVAPHLVHYEIRFISGCVTVNGGGKSVPDNWSTANR